jgi:hypothetical protein
MAMLTLIMSRWGFVWSTRYDVGDHGKAEIASSTDNVDDGIDPVAK